MLTSEHTFRGKMIFCIYRTLSILSIYFTSRFLVSATLNNWFVTTANRVWFQTEKINSVLITIFITYVIIMRYVSDKRRNQRSLLIGDGIVTWVTFSPIIFTDLSWSRFKFGCRHILFFLGACRVVTNNLSTECKTRKAYKFIQIRFVFIENITFSRALSSLDSWSPYQATYFVWYELLAVNLR